MNIKQIPNIITSIRIFGSISLLFLSIDNIPFWIVYLLCGVSDMFDGTIARKLNATSKTGAMLDSIADLIMVAICAWKFFPLIASLPSWIWIWIGGIAIIKLINVISSLIVYKSVLFPHTIANKITGFIIFLVLPLIFFINSAIIPAIACTVATFAAIQEGHIIRTRKTENLQ